MSSDKFFLAAEEAVMDNVANKLQVYMERHNLTLHGLASKLNFQYQAMWRLVNKKHSPTITSLAVISQYFDCTINELISDNIFIDIELFDDIDNFISNKLEESIRIYIPYKQFETLAKQDFFAINKIPDTILRSPNENKHNLKAFYKVTNIDIDGLFLVKYENMIILLDIYSVSSQFVWANINQEEVKIAKSEITPIAKFFNYINLLNNTKFILTGVTKCKNL